MADMLFCGLRYGCGLSDYRLYHFETLTGAQRKTYLTRGYNNRVVKLVNDPANHVLFDNKVLFLEKFGKYAGRDWLDLQTADPAAFARFLDGKDEIIVKPLSGSCGKGIEKLKKADFESSEKMFETIKNGGFGLAEECLIQHPDISAIYPLSVNTLRIVTIYAESEVHVLYAFIRIGNHGAVVDNLNSGGMCAPIDVETGVISHPGYDRDETVYEKHPYTGTEIVGRKIPMWDRAVEICIEAANSVPNTRYIAWDVCMTEDGPVFVEGTPIPGTTSSSCRPTSSTAPACSRCSASMCRSFDGHESAGSG
jgi:glutathione synthase/RimK-type ligase-like ATP-grasp enzyme